MKTPVGQSHNLFYLVRWCLISFFVALLVSLHSNAITQNSIISKHDKIKKIDESNALDSLIKLREKVNFSLEMNYKKATDTFNCLQKYNLSKYNAGEIKELDPICYAAISEVIQKVKSNLNINRLYLSLIAMPPGKVLGMNYKDLLSIKYSNFINKTPNHLIKDKYLVDLDFYSSEIEPLSEKEYSYAQEKVNSFWRDSCELFTHSLGQNKGIYEKSSSLENELRNHFCQLLFSKNNQVLLSRFQSGVYVLQEYLKFFKSEYVGFFRGEATNGYIRTLSAFPGLVFLKSPDNARRDLESAMSKLSKYAYQALIRVKNRDQQVQLNELINKFQNRTITEIEYDQLWDGLNEYFEFASLAKYFPQVEKLDSKQLSFFEQSEMAYKDHQQKMERLKLVGLVGLSIACYSPDGKIMSLASKLLSIAKFSASARFLSSACFYGGVVPLTINLYAETLDEYSRMYDLYVGTIENSITQTDYTELQENQRNTITTLLLFPVDLKYMADMLRSSKIPEIVIDKIKLFKAKRNR